MTYADSITLLMAFFVMLFSISQLDHEKFIEITEAIEKELGQRDPGERLSPSASSSSEEESEDSENETSDEDSFAQSDLVALNDLMSSLDSEGAMVQARPKGFEIELNAKLLYASGSAELRKGVRGTLSKVGEQLMEFGEDECLIEVQGHTDSAPISSGRYASNWELSAARATGVVRFFIDQGLPPSQLRAIAFSDTQPKVMPGDEGVLPVILAEMDEKLSVAELQVVIRRDGRLRLVDLENVSQRNRRISQMHENMRLVLARAIAGFDLQLPKKADREFGAWPQYSSELMKLPSSIGSIGAVELAHGVKEANDGLLPIVSSGRGTMSPSSMGASTPDHYALSLEARAVFDIEQGILRERRWTVLGMPTASSAMAEGGDGIPYGQRGLISYLPSDQEAPVLGETMEVAPPGATQTAIHPWVPLGRPAGQR